MRGRTFWPSQNRWSFEISRYWFWCIVRVPHALALTDGFGSIAGVIRVAPLALDSVGFWGLVFLYGTSMELFGGFALWYCIGNVAFVI